MSTRGASWLGRRSRIAGALVGCACAAAIALPGAASADVPAGYDLFETSPQQTHVNFAGAIPANFFDPGSDPFNGVVLFGGEQLGTFMGRDVGDADTVIRRLAPAPLGPTFPDSATVPIEIVALNLVSVQPITVTYGTDPSERWDVSVDLQPVQAQGQMQITQTAARGGTFDTLQLPVNVVFTFTRLSDGAQRVQPFAGPPFQSSGTPWRNGCVAPALVSNLSSAFCPGLTPDGQKKLTLEQQAFAQHGVYPAQPRLEHFQCYTLRRTPFQPRQVTLQDQFRTRQAQIQRRKELCNPVRKNQEKLVNGAAHLVCYGTRGPSVNKLVAIRNQFGSQRLQVLEPRRLCLPSQKRKPVQQFKRITPAQRIDHFQCYQVQAQGAIETRNPINQVALKDQFGSRQGVVLGPAFQLCAPTRKNKSRSNHLVSHLVCYKFTRQRKRRKAVIRNQFETRGIITKRREFLCVPSVKQVL